MDKHDKLATLGVLLLTLSIYILLSPGRIDIIDGQWRYEVAHSIATGGSVAIADPALESRAMLGADGRRYGIYGLSGSLVAAPLVMIAEFFSPGNRDLAQFMFSLASPIFAAATLGCLYFFYRRLEIAPRAALAWVAVLGFSTLYLPLASSVFDQAQNSFFVLIAFFGTHLARRRQQLWPALVGAMAFAVLINFKEAYIALWPGLLLVAGLGGKGGIVGQLRTNRNLQIQIAGGILGLAVFFAFNLSRFDLPFPPRVPGTHPPIAGNFFFGIAGLTISPGKGLLWYSPSVLLLALGWKRFSTEHAELAKGIAVAGGYWTALIASLSFFAGDWCWGPRYWVPILPLVFLAAPFARFPTRLSKSAAAGIVAVSLAVQLLAVTVDHQRFFFARGLTPFFWYENDSFYFDNSALLARVGELAELRNPETNRISGPFRPGAHPESLTYAVFGPASAKDRLHPKEWLEKYPVFSLPRPWPLWSAAIADERMARVRAWALAVTGLIALAGILLLGLARHLSPRAGRRPFATTPPP